MSETPAGVPLLDLEVQYKPLRAEILAAIERVCDSQRFIMGPEITALEHEMAGMLGVRHAVAVSSGTDALLLALMALDIKAGDEVVTPTYSFFATAGAVARLGATPVLVDIDDTTFNMDPAKLAAAITPKTKAIIPVHLFGQSAEMDSILNVASEAGIPVVEDAAQAIGATYKSRPLGGLGAFGCFSFFPSKNLGAFGDAGLVTANDDALAKKARLLRTHGMEPRYYHHLVGANFRMDALQAAILRVKAPHLAGWTERRRANADRYRTLFQSAGLTDRVALPAEASGSRHIYNQFVIRTADRDGLKKHLDAARIGNEIYYPVPFHQQPCFAYLGHRAGDFPKAERAAQESLAIPIYSELTLAQQQTVVDAVAAFVHRRVAV
jgi:dTDP-4-amino-4,6-dideoxygalactose transaminase